MRKEPKNFTVEVKRRPGVAAKKPRPFAPVAPEPAAPPPSAAVLFRAPAPEEQKTEASERRILPCLVTEAALDAAKAEALADHAPVARPRGRPRKERPEGELASAAPRKRGRPRKNPVTSVTPVVIDRTPAPPSPVAPVVVAPYQPSARAITRRSAVAELPRGDRWKRRLPKALR
jgi:hypothetical protein